MQPRTIIAFAVVGLYAVVVLTLLGWGIFSADGTPEKALKAVNKARFLQSLVALILTDFFSATV